MKPGSHGFGASAKLSKAELSLQDCDLSGDTGFILQESASLIMQDCRTFDCGTSGVMLYEGVTEQISNWTSTRDYLGFQSFGASLDMKGCQFSKFSIGAEFKGKGQTPSSISHCTFTEPRIPLSGGKIHTAGLLIHGGGETVTMNNCVVHGTGMSCIAVLGKQSTITLIDCEFSESKRNGVEVNAEGSKAILRGCRLNGHKRYGVMCLYGTVVADHTHSTRNRQGVTG